MAFYFGRGLCYRQNIAAVTSLGFVWNAWLSKRLFFSSLSFSFVVLRLFVRIHGRRVLSSSTRAVTRLRLMFAASFLPDIYAGTLFCLSLLLAFIDVTLLDYRFFELRFLVYIVSWTFYVSVYFTIIYIICIHVIFK